MFKSLIGDWPSLVRRLLWEQEIVGSNPTFPTSFESNNMKMQLELTEDMTVDMKIRVLEETRRIIDEEIAALSELVQDQ